MATFFWFGVVVVVGGLFECPKPGFGRAVLSNGNVFGVLLSCALQWRWWVIGGMERRFRAGGGLYHWRRRRRRGGQNKPAKTHENLFEDAHARREPN
jgi:hypothetical protein